MFDYAPGITKMLTNPLFGSSSQTARMHYLLLEGFLFSDGNNWYDLPRILGKAFES